MKFFILLFISILLTNNLPGEISPFTQYEKKGRHQDYLLGKKIISEGKAGCILVAGGQGTRLGYSSPKGFFPITLIKQKTLYQIFAEKVLAAGRQVNRKLQFAIMTSKEQLDNTTHFFKTNHYFGLEESQVHLFAQDDYPFLTEAGLTLLGPDGKIAAGPDGNAAVIKKFCDLGIWENWINRGIEYVTYQPIDNPLADPFDAELIGFHARQKADAVCKCIERTNPFEKLGVVILNEGKIGVIEYSEITDEIRESREANGCFRYPCANISLFSFKMDFIKEISAKHYGSLPYHKAWKAVDSINGKTMAWKFEKFIFDILPYAGRVYALLYPRNECFAPLKNAEGSDTVQDVQAALFQREIDLFEMITEKKLEAIRLFELDPQFYYPTEEMLIKWKGKNLPESDYINP